MNTRLQLSASLLFVLGCDQSQDHNQPVEPVNSEPVVERSEAIDVTPRELNLVEVPAGKFMMGSLDSEEPLPGSHSWKAENEFQHEVIIEKPFLISDTEITRKQWTDVMGTAPWLDYEFYSGSSPFMAGDNYPANMVSWIQANDFCRKLSEREGRRFRLPSEQEWEYSCRGNTTTAFSFGNDPAALMNHGWHQHNCGDQNATFVHQVAQFKPNPFKLFDMHGNVSEWTSSRYSADYSLNPTTRKRVVRGGSWGVYAFFCRSAVRFGEHEEDTRNVFIGFRVVCDVEPKTAGTLTQPVEAAENEKPLNVSTPEIIKLLETGDLTHISTRHDQSILIRLHDGSEYQGKYTQPSSGRYANDEQLFDIYNLVRRITDARDDLEHFGSLSVE